MQEKNVIVAYLAVALDVAKTMGLQQTQPNTHTWHKAFSILPGRQPPPSPLLSALWNLHLSGLISVYKSQIASTHFICKSGYKCRKREREGERAEPKVVTAHAFFTRAVNASTIKHQHAVILMSGLRGDSLAGFSLTHRVLPSLTGCLTEFVHAWDEWCSMENWPQLLCC